MYKDLNISALVVHSMYVHVPCLYFFQLGWDLNTRCLSADLQINRATVSSNLASSIVSYCFYCIPTWLQTHFELRKCTTGPYWPVAAFLSLHNKLYVGALFVDLSKCFDCMPHAQLISKLDAYGVTPEACQLIHVCNYLCNRVQRTKVRVCRTPWAGITKGSGLGLMFFDVL